MPWVKLDDGFYSHPKVLAAGKDGRALIVSGLCYCAQGLTDGLIVDGALPMVAGAADVKPKPTAGLLVELGVWHREGHDCPSCAPCPAGHYLVHDYGRYQPSRRQVEDERAAGLRRQTRSRESRRLSRRDSDRDNERSHAGVSPDPVPVPPDIAIPSVSSTDSPAAPDDDDHGRLAELLDAVAALTGTADHEQAIADGVVVRNRRAHLQACIDQRRAQDTPAVRFLVSVKPEWADDPVRLARALRDDERIPKPAPHPAQARPACARCSGSTLVLDDAGVAGPCPDCRRPPLRAIPGGAA